MKTRMTLMVCGVWLALGLVARAQNNCIEGGPYTNYQSCVQSGKLSPGYGILPNNITVSVGQPIPQPAAYGLSITNGLESYYVSYDCSPQRDQWYTNSVNYSIGFTFNPPFPEALWVPGLYSYTGQVTAAGSPCGLWTTNIGTVMVNVGGEVPDVLIDVDFGGGTVSPKSGPAVVGDYSTDFWNEYDQTNEPSGSLTNLLTVQKFVSPVGLLVTNLQFYGSDGSSDPMYNAFLLTNNAAATVTITNLPTGTWDFYLYANLGIFDLSVTNFNSGEDYGLQWCYDDNPQYSWLWIVGTQYVVYTNVSVIAGGSVTITVNPGNEYGEALLSGLQIVSASHKYPPVIINQPSSVNTNIGATTTFSVDVTGSPSSYQWFWNGYALTNGGNVDGANSSTLTLTNLTLQDAGTYYVKVSNLGGSATSYYAALRVSAPSSVAVWGYDGQNQTSVPAGLTNAVAVAGGAFSFVLNEDGTMSAWGDNFYGESTVPANVSNVVAVACGYYHDLVLNQTGALIAWGDNQYGQTNIPAGLTNVIEIASGWYHNLALEANGTVTAWGWNAYGQSTVPAGLSNVVAVAGGAHFSLALKDNGTVVAWGGSPFFGETNVPPDLTNVVAISAGGQHGMALLRNGTVVAWGYNGWGQCNVPATLTNAIAVSAGDDYSAALTANGTVVVWGNNSYGQTRVPANVSNVVAIAAQGYNVRALLESPPVIVVQPVDQDVFTGDSGTFTVTAIGGEPLYYQWYLNTTALSGDTNSTLTIQDVGANGNYSVSVANAAGSVTSSVASLTVTGPPTVTVQPADQTMNTSSQGGNANFTGAVSGTVFCDGPYTYHWLHDGTNMGYIINTVAGVLGNGGSTTEPDDGLKATNVNLTYPYDVAVDHCGNLYIACGGENVIQKVDTNGIITTIAGYPGGGGTGETDSYGDGLNATNAILNDPMGVKVDMAGNIYIADLGNHLIRKVGTNGIITVVAGGGQGGLADGLGDGGPATNAIVWYPAGICVDTAGQIYIADDASYEQYGLIRKVDTNGYITVVAGAGQEQGPSQSDGLGDGGPATNAVLYIPNSVAVDAGGNIYIVDQGNNLIRKVDTHGIITTFAGGGTGGGADGLGDGLNATNAVFNTPNNIALDANGNVYVSDGGNGIVRMVDTNDIITVVAGNVYQKWGYSGDGGPATRAGMSFPQGIALDAAANLYIVDQRNRIVREAGYYTTNMSLFNLTYNDLGNYQLVFSSSCGSVTSSIVTITGIGLPYIMNQPTNFAVAVGGTAVFSVLATGTQPLSYQWYTNGILDGLATGPTLEFDDVQTNLGGLSCQVYVSNSQSGGNPTKSNSANLTVIPPPTITQQPSSQAALQGSTVTFIVGVNSVNSTNYQWCFNGTNLIGATNAAFTLFNVQTNDAGNYSVIVTNWAGSVTSVVVSLTVQPRPYVAFTGGLSVNLTNWVFQSDTTYFIDEVVNLYSNTVVEGGAVIKFSDNGTLNVLGPLNSKTGPFRPAVFTSMNDNSIGLVVPGSTGDPQTAANGLAYLNFQGWNWSGHYSADAAVSYLRFAYADEGLADESGLESGHPSGTYTATLHVWNCQFVDCNWGIADWFNANVAAYDLHNVLFGGCQSALGGWTSTNTIVTGEQLTSDTGDFWDPRGNTVTNVSLTNCIILGSFQFSSSTVISTNCVAFPSSEKVFQSLGAGNYYLPWGSPYHNAGTTNISPQMLAELTEKTTYAPPTVYSDQNLPNGNLTSQVPRDTGVSPNNQFSGTNALDLGWHYDPIDVAVSGVNVVNSTISVTPGTVIAAYASYSQNQGATYGLNIDGGSQFTCQGLANNLNHIVQFNTVQEQAMSDWCEAYEGSVVCDFLGGTPAPSLTFRFTDWSIMGFDSYHLYEQSTNCMPINFQNCCQLYGGLLSSTYATMNFTNCLLERVYARFQAADGNAPVIRNNLFWHGTFNFSPDNSNSVVIDNLFDQSAIPNNAAIYTNYYGGYNAFVTNQDRLYPTNASDVILSNSLAYETSYFGNYYQPTNSPLINAGSTSATNVGLYHYTVLTNQTIEASNIVSIGYHYVATDTNGNPICTSGNGIPDYIADTNGTGLGDWADYYRSVLPVLSVVYGDGQYGIFTNFLSAPLVIQVTDNQYNPLTNAPLTFSVSNVLDGLSLTNSGADPILTNLYIRTDQNGYAAVFIYFETNAPATNIVYVTAVSDGDSTNVTSTDMVYVVDTPTINPAGGRFTTIQNITIQGLAINTNLPQPVVHYELDWANLDESSPVITNGQTLAIWQPSTVEAQTFDDAIMLPSLVQTGSFTFSEPLAAGSDFTLVLEPYGSILAGGSNGKGQLGDGTETDRPNLVSVLDITNAAGIAAGQLHSLAWDTNGNAWSWGDDSYGQLGNGSGSGNVSTPTQINGISNVIAMSAGYLHSLALESNGMVFAWGNNANGELGNNSTAQEDSPVPVNIISNIVAIAGGGSHSLALASNGMVYAWGNGMSGQLGNGNLPDAPQETPAPVPDLPNCMAIAAGYLHSLTIATDETVVAWGDNSYGQMGNGYASTPLASPTQVPGLSNIVAIAAGQYHNLALQSDGIVWAWGDNTYGQVGDGSTATPQTTPIQVVGISNVLAITAGAAHSAALLSDGNVVVWGVTNYGLNGTGGQFSTVPVISDPTTNVDWQPPVIVSEPMSQEVFYCDTVTFSVGAIGHNLTYQWTYNGTPIPGANSSSFTINNAGFGNYGEGTYAVTVANGMASVVSTNAQLTLDYFAMIIDPMLVPLIGAHQDYTFRSGMTYWVIAPVQLYGKTTIEPGAVIKFDNAYDESWLFGGAWPASTLQVFGSLDCKSAPYNPAVLTSVDDDSSGEISWDSGGPYYGGVAYPYPSGVPFLDLTGATNSSISYLRIAYADEGVATPANGRLDVWDCQFVTNNSAVVTPGGGTNSFHNVLFSGCGVGVMGSTNSFTIQAEQITACTSNFWTASNNTPVTVGLTNSIILTTQNIPATPTVSVNPPATDFQTSGAGSYYLSCNSPLHASGTTSISQRLLSEFQNKTTRVPFAFPALMQVNGTMTLFPRVPRYTNGPPDLGYYYDVLDYSVADMILNQGSLTVEPGTVIGSRMDFVATNENFTYIGFDMQNNSVLNSIALPNRPNVFTDVQSVQEGFEWPVMGSFVPDFFPSDAGAGPPILYFRFTDFYLNYCGYAIVFPPFIDGEPADHIWGGETLWTGDQWSFDSAVFLTLRDCKFEGGAIDLGFPDWGYYFPIDYVYGNASVACTNDSFDNVAMNLSPTWNSYGLDDQGPNVNMTVTLDNNSFKGSDWFFIEPLPLSEEGMTNWIFEDNLFDTANIIQDTTQPLDYAYNGYWAGQPGDLLQGVAQFQPSTSSSSDGFPSGQGEVTLTNAPPYQCGPFGNFYMPTNTQLFGAGSTSATNLGLYHYTTRLDQVIEGDAPAWHTNVDIGVHYVPATNVPSTTQYEPADTDGDGIPDYVEDTDGDGIVNTNDGTDWTTPYTLQGIWDPTNSAYMDTDLSGDGLVNRIKMALGLSPFCQTNPLTLTQVPTGEEPNAVAFEVPINYNTITNIGRLTLNVNGVDATVQNVQQATDGNCLLIWDTTFDPPGQEYLQACLALNSPIQNNNAVLTAYGPLYPFLSTNALQFFEADSMFTATSASLDAQLTQQNASYTISLYDPSTSTLLTTVVGSTSNGIIQESWGVTNTGGTPYMGSSVDAYFNVEPPGSGSASPGQASENGRSYPKKPLTRAAGQLTEWGPNFDFTYVWTYAPKYWYDLDGGLWNSIQPIVDELITPTSTTNERWLYYYNSSFDYYSTELAHPNPWNYGTTVPYPGYLPSQYYVTNTGSGLLQDLGNGLTKNFYFYGHGAPDESALENWDASVLIMSDTLISEFGNGPFWDPISGKFTGFQYRYPYRFVFLDACDTANLRIWYETFGIVPDDQTVNNIGPQAFVGWGDHVDPPEAYGLAVGQAYFATVQMNYYLWLSGYTVQQCIDYCSNPKNVQAPFPVAANHGLKITVDGEAWTYTFTPRLLIVGHAGLKIDGLNSDLDYTESSHIMYGTVPGP